MSANSFIFYESWSEFIETMDRETAKELVYQIYRVGLDKPMDTEDMTIKTMVNAFILPNIKGAKRRYNTAVANGKKSNGAPPKTSEEDNELIWQLHLEGLTYDEIVEQMDTYGVSISRNTVGDRVRKRKEAESTKTNNQEQEPNTETKNKNQTETFKNKEIFNNKLDTYEDDEEEIDVKQPLHYNF